MTMDDPQSDISDGEVYPSPQLFPPAALTVRLATRREAIQIRTAVYFSSGKRHMSLEQYLQRDAVLETVPASNNGKLNTWVLVPRDYPRHPYLAACETHKRESLFIRSGDATVSFAISFGIASVFTPEKFRNNGYARFMLRLLHYILAPPSRLPPFPYDIWGAPPVVPTGYQFGFGEALFSVLYSDVGEGAGGPIPEWDVRDPWSVVWPVSDEPPVDISRSLRWLSLDDLEGYLAADRWRVIAEDLPGAAAASCPSSSSAKDANLVHITTPPAFAQITYLISRYLLSLREPPPKNMHWGAGFTSASGEVSYVTWVPEPTNQSTLMISRMRCDNVTSFGILLSAAMHQARQLGLKRVEIWNTMMDWPNASGREAPAPFGGKWIERSEHLPALAWYGVERTQNVIWHLNERFAWC